MTTQDYFSIKKYQINVDKLQGIYSIEFEP